MTSSVTVTTLSAGHGLRSARGPSRRLLPLTIFSALRSLSIPHSLEDRATLPSCFLFYSVPLACAPAPAPTGWPAHTLPSSPASLPVCQPAAVRSASALLSVRRVQFSFLGALLGLAATPMSLVRLFVHVA